jgi:4-aminobutyrate--pyruvate transaminase
MAGLWRTSLGCGEKRLVEAARRQMEQLPTYHMFNSRSTEPSIEAAEELLKIVPKGLSKVLFANSGSEANDQAAKVVWFYNNALGRPRKKRIIGRVRGYHGITVFSGSSGLPPNHIRGSRSAVCCESTCRTSICSAGWARASRSSSTVSLLISRT